MAENLNSGNFDAEVLQSPVPVLVDFYADWCPPCRAMLPVISEITENADGKYKVFKVNTDDEPELAVKYKITSLPTFMIFQAGQAVSTVKGLQPKNRLTELLKE